MPTSLARTEWIGFSTIVIREFNRIVRIWGQTIVPPTVTATLYFVIFGSLIGKRVGLVGGYDYMQFIAPGLIMMTVITNSYGNVVSSFFGAKFGKHLEELLVSPLPNWLILVRLRGRAACCAGCAVGAVVTLVALVLHAPGPCSMCSPSSARCSSPASCSRSADSSTPCLPRTSTRFPGSRPSCSRRSPISAACSIRSPCCPLGRRSCSHANPILYMVSAFRYGFLGQSDVDLRLAYGIMIGSAVLMFALAVTLLNRGAGIRE